MDTVTTTKNKLHEVEAEVREVLTKYREGGSYTIEHVGDDELAVYTNNRIFSGTIMWDIMETMEKYLLEVGIAWYIDTTTCYDNGALRTIPCLRIFTY